MTATVGWDASTYDRISNNQVAQGVETLDRLELAGHEVVLDAGCGSGRVTELLLERLTDGGRVVATDADPDMVRHTRERFADRADRVTVLDPVSLTDLVVDEPVDAVFSNAVFHWVLDHDALFARLHAALRPGGRLATQCGGFGNIQAVRDATGPSDDDPWYYATPADSIARLERLGFSEVRAWLQPWPVVPEDPRLYLEKIVLRDRPHLVDEVLAHLGDPPTLDYVRLNLEAVA